MTRGRTLEGSLFLSGSCSISLLPAALGGAAFFCMNRLREVSASEPANHQPTPLKMRLECLLETVVLVSSPSDLKAEQTQGPIELP